MHEEERGVGRKLNEMVTRITGLTEPFESFKRKKAVELRAESIVTGKNRYLGYISIKYHGSRISSIGTERC